MSSSEVQQAKADELDRKLPELETLVSELEKREVELRDKLLEP